jgi:hypothetical protein
VGYDIVANVTGNIVGRVAVWKHDSFLPHLDVLGVFVG